MVTVVAICPDDAWAMGRGAQYVERSTTAKRSAEAGKKIKSIDKDTDQYQKEDDINTVNINSITF